MLVLHIPNQLLHVLSMAFVQCSRPLCDLSGDERVRVYVHVKRNGGWVLPTPKEFRTYVIKNKWIDEFSLY